MQNSPPSPEPADEDKPLRLAEGSETAEHLGDRTWKLLVVDDEEEVHGVTHLALDGFTCRGRRLELLSAYSGAEACEIFRQVPDIAVILLDVVMETDHAGLDVVRFIREELKNPFVRIILRTGQPGQAPEHRVITDYDINDYKYKTELTRQKLFTTVYTSISSYRDLVALEANRRGLEEVIEASAQIFDLRSMERFADGVLEQLTALLYLDQDAIMIRASGLAAAASNGMAEVVAGSGRFRHCRGQPIDECGDKLAVQRIQTARKDKKSIFGPTFYVGFHADSEGHEHLLYVSGESPLSVPDRHLVDLFIRNVSIATTNVRLFNAARSPSPSPDKANE